MAPGAVILLEGLALMLFSSMTILPLAIATMILFSLFVQMASGATFSVVPFINKKAMGTVAGIVGAGGNAGAVAAGFLFVAAGFLFKVESLSYAEALFVIGIAVVLCSSLTLLVRFSPAMEKEARAEMDFLLTEERVQKMPQLAYEEVSSERPPLRS